MSQSEGDEPAGSTSTARAAKRHALELNDGVLQRLVVAKLAFESGHEDKGHDALNAGLASLRAKIDALLAESASLGELDAGDFVREEIHDEREARPSP
ncbi:MAG: hypothetical protein M3238_06630 [Actinomycetota bacterium]|nr:hypothetical protein [Actinomycetota bacterium]